MVKKILIIGVGVVATLSAIKCYKIYKHNEYIDYIIKISNYDNEVDVLDSAFTFLYAIFNNYKKHGQELYVEYKDIIDEAHQSYLNSEISFEQFREDVVSNCHKALTIVANNL